MTDNLGSNNLPVPYCGFASPIQIEDLRARHEAALRETVPEDEPAQLWARANLAGIAYVLGDSAKAVEYAQAAVAAHHADTPDGAALFGYLHNTLGAAHCSVGDYPNGLKAFDQAEIIFSRAGDALGMAWKQHLFAREYLRDFNRYQEAQQMLNAALMVLRSRASAHAVIENMLTQIDCAIHQNELRRSREVSNQVEHLLHDNRNTFFWPELWWIRAEIALLENNPRTALQACSTGLGAVSNLGDLRMLCILYTTLATALETDKTRLDDAKDALERATSAGRTRSRSLHLAMALRQLGLHLRRYYNHRPTVRARGSGYLFEADGLFRKMGMVNLVSPAQMPIG